MGTHVNFNNLGGGGPRVGEGSNQMNSTGSVMPLARQSSVYSLTFDELQNTLGGPGKDFGSMNMDELLKSIWTAEEAQAMTMTSSSAATEVVQPGPSIPVGNLQRQGSLTLPRTISQMTVDEVWKSLITKGSNANLGSSSGGGGEPSAPPGRQQTLGEMTLEEFLFRAGVVREDNCTQHVGQVNGNNNNGFYGNNNAGNSGFGFGQPIQNTISFNGNNDSMILNQPPGLGLKVGGSMQQQQQHQLLQQQQQHLQQQQQQLQQRNQPHPKQRLPQTIFPKHTNVAFSAPVSIVSNGFTGAPNNVINSNNGLASYGGNGVTVAVTSPGTSSAENNSLSPVGPVPYVLNQGRRNNTCLDKVIERRQRRMIKNRESAAKSRARKQAYTLELEAELENLKKKNQELRRKQAEMMETQKDELKETSKQRWGSKKQCLRRTLTGPW